MKEVKLIWDIIEDNVPVDCKEIINELKLEFLRDVRDMGLKEALKNGQKRMKKKLTLLLKVRAFRLCVCPAIGQICPMVNFDWLEEGKIRGIVLALLFSMILSTP